MRHRHSLLSLFAVLVIGLLALNLHGGFVGAQSATPVGTPPGGGLTFDVRFNDTLLVADESAGFQLGDRVILSDRLLAQGEEVGHNAGVCTITDAAGGEMICVVTWLLPEGTISTQLLNTPPEKTFAVIGGTGAYEGATGAGVLIEDGDGTGTVSFYLAE